ncbi:DUF1688 family protein, partial [Bradyrhizobium sp.]|uniref:DUF1688 family protein n=1 Tax=Bradyrhizobium sp. TaxID=376 RepID=UPI00290B44B1
GRVSWPDAAARARAEFDLAITSVLLDAGAGAAWRYQDAVTGTQIGRSEGLALASLDMFASGAFSADAGNPLRADATKLKQLTVADLERGFQVGPDNPLVGLEGRVALLRRLKALGVRVSMDDFGSGYSSLSYLQAFPFDKIKIDRAFVMNLGRNPQSAAIIRAVIGLGHGMNMSIVAEGVETPEQLGFLAEQGCDSVQGYLLGKPLPIDKYDGIVGRAHVDAITAVRKTG